jgi:hypothetical protein
MGHSRLTFVRNGVLSFQLALCGLVVWPALASAQSGQDRADARAAAQEGLNAFREERWADCSDLFGRAESLMHAPPHLLYSARCNAKLGHYVAARELYRKILGENLTADAPPAFRGAQASAKDELVDVEPKLARLKIVVQGADGKPVSVTMDGVAVPAAVIGIPRQVDPGEHALLATAEGLASDTVKVTLAEKEQKEVVLELVPSKAQPASDAAGAESGAGTASASTALGPAQDLGRPGKPGLRIGSYVAFGVGAVGLAAGTVFTLRSRSKRSEVEGLCGASFNNCPTDQREKVNSLNDEATTSYTLGLVGFGVGVVGVGAGVALFILSSGKKPDGGPTAGVSLQPWVAPNGAGVVGRF